MPKSKKEIEELSNKRRREILNSPDGISPCGKVYYVSADGKDENDGKAPERAWKTLERVSAADLEVGDVVRLRRGDVFRGTIFAKSGVTYTAFGEGEKPRIYGGPSDLACSELWECVESTPQIWKYKGLISDCGTLVFNGGERHSRKLIPSYRGGIFVCRDDESREFIPRDEMTRDLDIFCRYEGNLTTVETKGESFPVPTMDDGCIGELYLRCDLGNPGEVFDSIEAVTWNVGVSVGDCYDVRVDNLCIKYAKFGVSAGGDCVRGLKVTGCEIGWIGGNIQNYLGLDPNYLPGRRGSVTRYGNGVEIYGGCDGYEVSDCYIYQCYDAGVTHQISTRGKKYELKNIVYRDNLIENCVYSVEYFLEREGGDTESIIGNCKIYGNIMIDSGYGWGQQRHNVDTPAHIKGWSYENTARDFEIYGNIFMSAAYRMIHLVARDRESCPLMHGNTYAQKCGLMLGQYGANRESEPPIIRFDESVGSVIESELCERDATVIFL